MQHSLDFYVEEIPDYGIEDFVESWADAGLTRLRPTVAYHPVRILSPDNPRRVLLDLEGDVCFLDASAAAHFAGPLVPVFSDRYAGVIEQIADAALRRSVGLDCWAVFLNNVHLARLNPNCACQSPLGSPDLTWLSPAHPAVLDYCVGLVRAVGSSGLVELIQCEALYHVPFPCHPSDRVNISVVLSDLDLWLAGVCISPHSLGLIGECGGDGERAAATLRHHLQRRLRGQGPALPKTLDGVLEVLGEDAEAVLGGRALATNRVHEAMAAEARSHGLRLEFEDDIPSWESFYSGVQEGPLSSERQWEVGVDRDAIARVFDEVGILLYFNDEERVRAELTDAARTYGRTPRVLHRPYHPDVRDVDTLAARLSFFAECGVPESVLYMQSLMPAGTRERVRDAIARGAPRA
jgi:hypothetical protein